ncbi:MAG: transcriptional repressor NrdR [Deltaproteobacteria bacterium]|nr:transcriptional repressor NrdR [Deltaproteobacteria bacterium]
MDCPACQHADTRVIDSREALDSIRRRRECQECEFRFTTFERVEFRLPDVVKKDGRRQAFNRDKLLSGLRLACRKRPVTEEQLDVACGRVERELAKRSEVSTREVGDLALLELRNLDDVAYLRFASVYHEITSPADFLEVLRPLLERATPRESA